MDTFTENYKLQTRSAEKQKKFSTSLAFFNQIRYFELDKNT